MLCGFFLSISLYVFLLLFPASVFFFIFCFLCFPQHCSHSSFPPSTSSLSHMSSPLFSSRTMRVSCRPCRSRLRPAPLLQRQRKRRKKRKKVKSGDGNFLLYSFWICTIRLALHLWSKLDLIIVDPTIYWFFYRASLKVIQNILDAENTDCALWGGSGTLIFVKILFYLLIYDLCPGLPRKDFGIY